MKQLTLPLVLPACAVHAMARADVINAMTDLFHAEKMGRSCNLVWARVAVHEAKQRLMTINQGVTQ